MRQGLYKKQVLPKALSKYFYRVNYVNILTPNFEGFKFGKYNSTFIRNLIMLKKYKLAFLALFLSSPFASAETVFQEGANDLLSVPLLQDSRTLEYSNNLSSFLDSITEDKNTNNLETGIGPITNALAPPLTYLQAYAAISTQHPTYEYFPAGLLTSSVNHGGDELYIVTVEIGYGNIPLAEMNGFILEDVSHLFVQNPNERRIIDATGRIVGFYTWWSANGIDSGRFTYRNTSTNAPRNTLSDGIVIR